MKLLRSATNSTDSHARGAAFVCAASQPTEYGPRLRKNFCHSERSEESLFDFYTRTERFLAPLGMTKIWWHKIWLGKRLDFFLVLFDGQAVWRLCRNGALGASDFGLSFQKHSKTCVVDPAGSLPIHWLWGRAFH
jgi:hypothetical protein